MTIQFVESLDSEKVIDHINEIIKNERFTFDLWTKVKKACEKFEGKKITKRIESEVEKVLPEYNVSCSFAYGMYQLTIYGNGLSYSDRKTFYLGYETNPVFTMENFIDKNMWAELEEERANKLEGLKPDEIGEMVELWNHGLSELKTVYEWARKHDINYMSYGFDINTR